MNDGGISNYGFGWFIYENDNRKIVTHSGNLFGFRTYICRDLVNKNAYILLTNKGDAIEMNTIISAIIDFLDPTISE